MECSPFARGFIPGILIGLFSSVLLFNTLWREPSLTQRQSNDYWLAQTKFSHFRTSFNSPSDTPNKAPRKGRAVENNPEDCDSEVFITRTQSIEKTNVILLILIHSTPRATDLRNSIRASWLGKQNPKFLAKFVIGSKDLRRKDIRELCLESKQYGDIVFLSEVEDTLKTIEWSSSIKLLQSFKWASENIEFSYILKCTDSSFVVLDEIMKELELRESLGKKEDYLWGFFAGGIQAVKEGRLSEDDWFLCTHYLPFPQGGGYVISHGLVSLLLSLEPWLQHYAHDDIALGVWISPFTGVNKRHDVRFNSGYYSRGCNNAYILTHKETTSSMMQKYLSLVKNGFICKEEFVSRLSYNYNWTASVNRCCVRAPNIP